MPTQPTAVAATPDDRSATLTWDAPASDGRRPVTDYRVTLMRDGNFVGWRWTGGPATSLHLDDLTNGSAYTFIVAARNAVGIGPDSQPSDPTTPRTIPDAPTITSASPGNASATISWDAPTSDGGAPITEYTVRAYRNGAVANSMLVDGSAHQATMTGLTNGNDYFFTVTAANVAGDGPESPAHGPVRPTVLAVSPVPIPLPVQLPI
jgi:hypothetical protein